MFRVVLALATLVSARASRVINDNQQQLEMEATWGSSCESLQTRFRDRLAAMQVDVEAIHLDAEISTRARIRLTSRMLGVARILRRARECSWLLDNTGDDMDELHDITGTLLAANPCAAVARVEMEEGSSAEDQITQMQSLSRALSLLMSDDCELVEQTEQAEQEVLANESPLEQMEEAEEELQDRLDELMDEDSGSFIQVASTSSLTVARTVSVCLLVLMLAYTCLHVMAIVLMLLTVSLWFMVSVFYGRILVLPGQTLSILDYAVVALVNVAGAGVFFGGLIHCAYGLYNHLVSPYLLTNATSVPVPE